MKIGFLIIGSEVLDGKISDSNTRILADFLKFHHLEIAESCVVRDDRQSIEDALRSLFLTCDVVVTSGGLGPTKDDITKETLGNFLEKKLIYSGAAHEIAEQNYRRFERPFPGKEHSYCYLPEDFIALSNSTGFAPGLSIQHGDKFLFAAPGVPREFKSMVQDHLINFISSKLTHKAILETVIIRTKKIPEEKIFGEVDPGLWEKLEQYGEVSSLPNLMGVDIGVKLKAKDQNEMATKVASVRNIIKDSPLAPNVWHYGPESIEEKIVTLANQKNIKFGFAESATGGLCSHRITNIPGSSRCFFGAVVCYDEKVKQDILGVKAKTLKECEAVSLECAEEMAQGLREKFGLDIAVSITGFAGPGGGSARFPVGAVCIGKCLKNSAPIAQSFKFKGDREILKQRFSQAALHALLEELEQFA